MNSASGAKLLWMMTNSNSLWTSYMRNKYMATDNDLILASASVYDSGTWKFIISSRDLVLGNILFITNGGSYWSTSSSYNLKFFWSSIRERAPISSSYKAIWFPNHCPKMSLCLLRALRGSLPTLDYLIRRTMGVSPTCLLCLTEAETCDHLFFRCSYTSYIWSVCRLKLGLHQKSSYSLAEEIKLFQSSFTKRTGIRLLARLTIPTTVWHIWKERNNRVFSGRTTDRVSLLNNIKLSIRILCTEEPKGGGGKLIMDNWMN